MSELRPNRALLLRMRLLCGMEAYEAPGKPDGPPDPLNRDAELMIDDQIHQTRKCMRIINHVTR